MVGDCADYNSVKYKNEHFESIYAFSQLHSNPLL